MVYGMEYDENNPSRSDPGYLVLDLKQLSQGRLKFHEQQMGGQGKPPKPRLAPPPQGKQQQNVQSPYYTQPQYSYGQYLQYQAYNNGYQPNTQQYQQQSYNDYQQQQQRQQQYYNSLNSDQTNAQSNQYPIQG